MYPLSQKIDERAEKELFRVVLKKAPGSHGEIGWRLIERSTGEQVCAGECGSYRVAYREARFAARAILERCVEREAEAVSPDDDGFHRPVALLDPSADRDDYLCAEGAHFL